MPLFNNRAGNGGTGKGILTTLTHGVVRRADEKTYAKHYSVAKEARSPEPSKGMTLPEVTEALQAIKDGSYFDKYAPSKAESKFLGKVQSFPGSKSEKKFDKAAGRLGADNLKPIDPFA
jgi:hypothetical protein